MGFEQEEEELKKKDEKKFSIRLNGIEYDTSRRRSSSYQKVSESDGVIIKRGLLKKKGLIFFNNRIVQITTKGILSYSDPKNPEAVKSRLDLTESGTTVKLSGRFDDTLEIFQEGKLKMVLKVSFSSSFFKRLLIRIMARQLYGMRRF